MEEIETKEEFIPSPLQIKFASIYLNVNKRITYEQIGKEIGISRQTIWNWLKKPDFRGWLNSKKMELVNDSLIDIYKVALRKALNGDFNFCKMILEMIGDYQPGMKLNTAGMQELIKIEVVQSQEQQIDQPEGAKVEDNQNASN